MKVNKGTSLPFYRPLNPAHIEKIDGAARWILEHIGIKIHDRHFLELMDQGGATVDSATSTVRFSAERLDKALAEAPRKFILHSRDGLNDIRLGEDRVYFTNGGRVFRALDVNSGNYRLTTLEDVANTAALVNRLAHINFYIIACQAHDLEPEHYHLNDFYHAFNATSKHVMGGCDSLVGVQQVWDLAALMAGGEQQLKERPFFSVITNPISPLTIESNTLNILGFCCSHGIPATCAPAPICGATAPATLAGALTQMHAEALAGVAIAQIFAPGSKVLYGAVLTAMDLRTMDFTMGSVEMAMMNAAAVQLAKRYDLPIYASAGVTESKRPDVQAGSEKSFSNLMVAMAGGDCVHLAAGMLDSGNSISYEQYVIDNEILGMVQRILAGINVTEETLALSVIQKVGPGGNYVMEDHTIDHMMDEFFYPDLCERHLFDIWVQQGRPNMLSRATAMVENILEAHKDCLDPQLNSRIRSAFPGIKDV
ncbi:trimethylamine methyltransferase family protein [Desulfoferrobacter suflitae]|uniref:trimethylamine methyltransferase family protein n=1 Tax=Desulfoferrobacter suflitae TaxID=2865782 RepID=UPI0021644416|nr:trimethylamine methyltransferase family protein [Desulfoferrobacter suflitae]MCK8600990.1 trimethylamine methyltransferase family protein [Desulfoferrobacter suflitae]